MCSKHTHCGSSPWGRTSLRLQGCASQPAFGYPCMFIYVCTCLCITHILRLGFRSPRVCASRMHFVVYVRVSHVVYVCASYILHAWVYCVGMYVCLMLHCVHMFPLLCMHVCPVLYAYVVHVYVSYVVCMCVSYVGHIDLNTLTCMNVLESDRYHISAQQCPPWIARSYHGK